MKKPLPISSRYWEKNIKSAIGNPIRIFVELIINSADSYQRLHQNNDIDPPFNIEAKYFPFSGKATITVKDDAEGMDCETLWKKIEYGAAESGLGEGYSVRGSMGIGLKDACLAMKNSKIVTIKDNKISRFNIFFDGGKPFVDPVTEGIELDSFNREKYEIKNNGTFVDGTIKKGPFVIYDPEKTCKLLENHFMMRKLLQLNDYNIYFQNNFRKKLTYKGPVGRRIFEEKFKIDYPGFGTFNIRMKVNRSKENLRQSGEFRSGGLIHFHDKYAVVDCTLWGFDNEPLAKKLFGEVEISELSKLLNKNEDVIDDKRRGLNRKHPFVEKLVKEIEKRLRIIIDVERKAEQKKDYAFNEKSLNTALKEINKIANEEIGITKGEGPKPPLELETETMTFYPASLVKIKAYQERSFYIVINPDLIKKDSKLLLKSENDDVEILTKRIELPDPDDIVDEKSFSKTIRVYSEKPGTETKIIATLDQERSTEVQIEVYGNPILEPQDGFAFVPDKCSVKEGTEKNAILAIEQGSIKYNQKITLSSSNGNYVHCPKEIIAYDNSDEYRIVADKIIAYNIPIHGKIVGKKATITAETDSRKTELLVKVVPPLGSLFKDIQFRDEDNNKVAEFVEKLGTMYVYTGHPLLKKYAERKKGIKSESFHVFTADIITRILCQEIVKEGVSRGSSQYPIFNPDNIDEEIQIYMDTFYHDKGSKFHDISIGLIKSINKKS